MGTFAGHALPGSFFIIFSLWRIFYTLKRYYQRRGYEVGSSGATTSSVEVFKNRITSPIQNVCYKDRLVPLDSLLKLTACVIGIIGEVYTGFNKEWHFAHIGNAQHSTMFACFGLSGAVEILIAYRLIRTSLKVEYIFTLIALLVEGFLFAFHLHGRTPVDIYIHMIFLGLIISSIVAGMFEVNNLDNPVYALISTLGLLVQGTWFWQVGAMLYPAASWMPVWDETSKTSIPRAANLFCYHLLIDFSAILLIAMGMSLQYCHPSKISSTNNLFDYSQSQAGTRMRPMHSIKDHEMVDTLDVDTNDLQREELTMFAVHEKD